MWGRSEPTIRREFRPLRRPRFLRGRVRAGGRGPEGYASEGPPSWWL